MEHLNVKTLTLNEAIEVFRNAGVAMSVEAFQKALIEGKFEFAVAIKLNQWKYIIYEKALLDYLRKFSY